MLYNYLQDDGLGVWAIVFRRRGDLMHFSGFKKYRKNLESQTKPTKLFSDSAT